MDGIIVERLFRCGDLQSGRGGRGYDSIRKLDGLVFLVGTHIRTGTNELALSGRKEMTLIFIKQKRDRNAERSNRNSTILL